MPLVFFYPPKNFWFIDVFRRHRKGLESWNGLIRGNLKKARRRLYTTQTLSSEHLMISKPALWNKFKVNKKDTRTSSVDGVLQNFAKMTENSLLSESIVLNRVLGFDL